MKTTMFPSVRTWCRLGSLGWLAIGSAGPLAGADKAPATHTLFMGADFSVEWRGDLRPVESVEGKSFVVAVDHQRDVVPVTRADLRVKIDDQLKLTRYSATLANFKAERVYTPANNPRLKAERSISIAMSATASSDLAAGAMNQAEASANQAASAAANAAAAGSLDAGALAAAAATAANAASGASATYQQSLAASTREVDTIPSLIADMEAELMRKEFDALELTFELSAPEPHPSAYMVVVTRYRKASEALAAERVRVDAEALPMIDATPRKIHLLRGGFDPGYELKDCQVHFYDGTSEIATNLSRKRVPLSTDDAFQFSVIDYAGQHRDQTVAPTPATAFWSEEVRTKLTAGQPARVVFVKVGKDGRPVGLFDDKGCTAVVQDPMLVAVLPDLRFFPAVAKGKAVEGVLALKLGTAVQ